MSAVLNPVQAEPCFIELSVDKRIKLQNPGHPTRNLSENQIWFPLPPHAVTVQAVMEEIKMTFQITGNFDLYLGNSILLPSTDARVLKVNGSKTVWVVPNEDCDVRMTEEALNPMVVQDALTSIGHRTLPAVNNEACGTPLGRPDVSLLTELSTNGPQELQSDSDRTPLDFHFNSNNSSVNGTFGSEEVAMEEDTVEQHTGIEQSTASSERGTSIFSSDETDTDSEIGAFERIKRKMSFSSAASTLFEDSDNTPPTKKFKGESQDLSTDTDHSNSGFEETAQVKKIIHVDQAALNSSIGSSGSEYNAMEVIWRELPLFRQEVLPSGSFIKFDFAGTNMSNGPTAETIPVVLVVQEFNEAGVRGTVIHEGNDNDIVRRDEPRFFEFTKIQNPSTCSLVPKKL